MPLPTKRQGESDADFIHRCMESDVMKKEYPKHDRRLAVCQKQLQKGSGHTEAPETACLFARPDAVRFAESDGQRDENGFRIVGYSGEVIGNHWYWGNLAFDLQGLKFAQARTPVLDSHATDRRLGFSTKQSIDEQVTFEGKFLSNSHAQEFRSDMKEGFPMQASLFVPPSVVEYVKDGASVQVNGKTLKGPGAVFRKATIQEVSMAVLGADSHTSATAFADMHNEDQVTFDTVPRKESTMPNATETLASEPMTAARLKSEFADVHGEVFAAGQADGIESEKQRFADLQEACGDDRDLLVMCFADGKSVTDALKMRNERLAKKLAAAKAGPSETAGDSIDPAVIEFQEQVPGQVEGDNGQPATFMDAVAKYQAEHNVTQGEAVDKCVDLYPELHAKMTGKEES